jgi:hypothetical protein
VVLKSADRVDNLAGVDTSQPLTGRGGSSPKGSLLEVDNMLGKSTEAAARRRTLRPRGELQTSTHLGAIHRCSPEHCY